MRSHHPISARTNQPGFRKITSTQPHIGLAAHLLLLLLRVTLSVIKCPRICLNSVYWLARPHEILCETGRETMNGLGRLKLRN